MSKFILKAILLLCTCAALVLPARDFFSRNGKPSWYKEIPYETLKEHLQSKRTKLAEKWDAAGSEQKKQIEADAAKLFFSFVTDSLMPRWKGTRWDFYGTSRTPGEGEIACGYFITTVLEDAGLNINHVKMAQQASSVIIKSLCEPSSVKWYSNTKRDAFLKKFRTLPDGLYIVGLDFHTGFLQKTGSKVQFLHSNYIGKKGVMFENADTSEALADSKLFVVGRLSGYTELIRRWLRQEPIPVKD